MNIKEIIRKKRNGLSLTKEEIEYFAFGAADGSVKDYQLSALLMAICFNGLDERETLELTDAMTPAAFAAGVLLRFQQSNKAYYRCRS